VLLTLSTESEEISTIEASLKDITNINDRLFRLKSIIAENMSVSTDVIDKIINNLPFEAFVETLRNNSKIDTLLSIYNANAYESRVEPNSNHILLAKLVAAGKVKTIVTTNFDQLIEKALEQQGKRVGHDYDVIYREEDFSDIHWSQNRCRLIKIHGSIDDKEAMAITLSRVARQRISAASAGIIRQVFSQGSHQQVLIIGYSCSDVFDLSPQIEGLTDNLKKVWLVQHIRDSASSKIEDIHDQEQKNPFKAFDNSNRLFINTGDLVEVLWKATLNELFPDHKALETIPDWNGKVKAWYIDSIRYFSDAIKYTIVGRIFEAIYEWRLALGRYESILPYARKHAREHDNTRWLEGFVPGSIGGAYLELGEYRKAIGFYKQVLKIARHKKNELEEGIYLGGIGDAYFRLGKYRKSIEFEKQAQKIYHRYADAQDEHGAISILSRSAEGRALAAIGSSYLKLREYQTAIELYKQALDIARQAGDVLDEGGILKNMGTAYRYLGEYSRAIEFYKQSLEIFNNIGEVEAKRDTLRNMDDVYPHLRTRQGDQAP
jgi:tetratricopeptide (TPR) repeat protein